MRKRKICIVTASRSEFGLLYWLIKDIKSDPCLKLQLVVSGMHLSPEFGLTYKEIEKEFKIDKKVETLLSSDTSVSIAKSIGLGQISFSEVFDELNPDLVLVLGDRFDIFSAVSAAMIAKIPIAHLHGGETTEGLIDESIRHSISKMSQLHFTSTLEYSNRLIQLGENPKNIFTVGSMGIENIRRYKLLSKKNFEKSIKFNLNKKNLLVTFHPVSLENNTSKKYFQIILDTIKDLADTNIIFTKTNSDTNGRIINQMIDNYVKKNRLKSISITSMGQIRYLSSLKYIDAVIGNSSSGLIEVPSFRIATINIGDRQKGRIRPQSVIDCSPNKNDLRKAINMIYSDNFKLKLKQTTNPYGNGFTSKKIIRILKKTNLDNLIKKTFYNIKI